MTRPKGSVRILRGDPYNEIRYCAPLFQQPEQTSRLFGGGPGKAWSVTSAAQRSSDKPGRPPNRPEHVIFIDPLRPSPGKFDLFDVLDADLSGELEFEEMIDGLPHGCKNRALRAACYLHR